MATNARKAIRLALRARVSAIAGLPPVAWEGQAYTPVAGQLYVRETLLLGPENTVPAQLGVAPPKRIRGLYQLGVFTPFRLPNTSLTERAEYWADALCAQFEPGTVLTYDGRSVEITGASGATLVPSPPDWAQLPVTIAWWCDVTNLLT